MQTPKNESLPPNNEENLRLLLQNPEIQAGLRGIEARISTFYEAIKEDGLTTNSLVHGVTENGTGITVAEHSTVEKPPAVKPEGQSPQAFEAQRKAWQQNFCYSVFSYRVESAIEPVFVNNLMPRHVDPEVLDTQEARILFLQNPNNAIERDELTLPREAPQPGIIAAYNGHPVKRFEDALHGTTPTTDIIGPDRPRQAVHGDLRFVIQKQVEHAERSLKANLAGNSEVAEKEQQNANELKWRIGDTLDAIEDNPEVYDRLPHVVHDAAKAEHIAKEVQVAMSKLIKLKPEERAMFESHLVAQMDKAGEAYNQDPIGVFENTKPRH
jgi:hypothetical protein